MSRLRPGSLRSDVQANTAILTELVKQSELAARLCETFHQIIDKPIPLKKERFALSEELLVVFCMVLMVSFLILRRVKFCQEENQIN
jgi:hypothetical protein